MPFFKYVIVSSPCVSQAKTSLSELSYLHHTSCIHVAYATAPCIKISIMWQPGTKVSETTGMPQSFPGGAVLNKKLTLSLGEKKTLNELKIFRWPLSPVQHRYILRNQAPPIGSVSFRTPKMGDALRTPPNFGPKEKRGLPLKNGGPTGRWSEFPGLGVEVAGFSAWEKEIVFSGFFWLEMSETTRKKNRNSLPDIQGGHLLVINGVITLINGLINE